MEKLIWNPFLPQGEYIPDGEPHVFGDRVYLYGSHDHFGSPAFCDNDYTVYSAPVDDLTSWRCEGVSFHKKDDPMANGIDALWAPDVVRGADGRYYLYYCYAFRDWMGVAVSDEPAGPFTFYDHVHFADGHLLGRKKNDPVPFDPGVIVDADGTAWLYSGFAPAGTLPIRTVRPLRHDGCWCLHLAADMCTIMEEPVCVIPDVHHAKGTGFAEHAFFEASSIRHFNGKYYLIYSSVNSHELCYAMSDSLNGGFVFGGTLVSNGDIGLNGRKPEEAVYCTGNDHGSVEYINGRYYVFHHRHTNCMETCRQALAEPIAMREDGSFAQAEMTSSGLYGKPLPGAGLYPAYICCVLMGAKGCAPYPYYMPAFLPHGITPYITQDEKDGSSDARQYIKNLGNGAVVGYKYFDLRNTCKIMLEVKGSFSGEIEVRYEPEGKPVTVIQVPQSRRLQYLSTRIPAGAENSALYLKWRGKGTQSFYRFVLRTVQENSAKF